MVRKFSLIPTYRVKSGRVYRAQIFEAANNTSTSVLRADTVTTAARLLSYCSSNGHVGGLRWQSERQLINRVRIVALQRDGVRK